MKTGRRAFAVRPLLVGVIHGRKGSSGKTIGLRADMDALPMEENTNLRWRSTIPGRFHGCGHDGHTTMLLGTARYLAETRNFAGDVAAKAGATSGWMLSARQVFLNSPMKKIVRPTATFSPG